MKLQTKKTIELLCMLFVTAIMSVILGACSGDPTPSDPDLSLSPSNLTFSSNKGDSKDLTITTSVKWVVVHTPSWLNASSTGGSGTTKITLTTTSENQSEIRSDVVEVKAINDEGKEISKEIAVSQMQIAEVDCEAYIPEGDNQMIMSYGMACVLECGDNTQYFFWKVYTATDYNKIKGDNDQIVKDAKTNWTRENVPSTLHSEILYNDCQPDQSYYLVTVPFASNGGCGRINAMEFHTRPATAEEPLAEVSIESNVIDEVHDGDQGPWYKWEIKKNGTCFEYYTYACASDTEVETMKDRKSNFGDPDTKGGISLAWKIWKESKKDQETHATTFNANNTGGREKLFRPYNEGATQWLTAKRATDKYLQIATFAKDKNSNWSGLIYNIVYKVENGRIIGGTTSDYYLTISQSSLSFDANGGSQNINVTSNDSWTVSSNQSWCVVSPTNYSNNGTFQIAVGQNTTNSERYVTITIKGTNSNISRTVTVAQAPSEATDPTVIGRNDYDGDKNLGDGGGSTSYTLSVSPSALSMAAEGESKSVNVTSNDSWKVTSNQSSWCTVSPTSGSNNGTFTVKAAANSTSSSRNATITIKGTNSGKSVSVSVTQTKTDPIVVGRNDYDSDQNLNNK